MIDAVAGFDVYEGEHQTAEDAADAEPQIGVAQERIGATQPAGRRQDHRFASVEHSHRVRCNRQQRERVYFSKLQHNRPI